MVGEGLFFSVLQREPKQQVSNQIDRLCDKFDSLQPEDPRRNTIVGYIAWLNVEFQAVDYLNIKSKTGPYIKPDGERAPLIARAFELMATGLHKKIDVLRLVTSKGLTTKTGKPVTPQSFDRILGNPIYAGWIPLSRSGECPPARRLHQPIITQELFDRVQAVRAGKVAIAVGREAESDFLSGLTRVFKAQLADIWPASC
jgi:hypothetical protein